MQLQSRHFLKIIVDIVLCECNIGLVTIKNMMDIKPFSLNQPLGLSVKETFFLVKTLTFVVSVEWIVVQSFFLNFSKL